MDRWLRDEYGKPAQDELDRLRKRLREGEVPDYDEFSSTFACAYHMVNFRKSLAALNASAPAPTARLLDLGCGSGAATAAALVYLASRGRRGPVEVQIMDRSRRTTMPSSTRTGSVRSSRS